MCLFIPFPLFLPLLEYVSRLLLVSPCPVPLGSEPSVYCCQKDTFYKPDHVTVWLTTVLEAPQCLQDVDHISYVFTDTFHLTLHHTELCAGLKYVTCCFTSESLHMLFPLTWLIPAGLTFDTSLVRNFTLTAQRGANCSACMLPSHLFVNQSQHLLQCLVTISWFPISVTKL